MALSGVSALLMMTGFYLAIANLVGFARLPCGVARPVWFGLALLTSAYSGIRVYAFYIQQEGKSRRAALPLQRVRIQNILSWFYVAFAILFVATGLRAC